MMLRASLNSGNNDLTKMTCQLTCYTAVYSYSHLKIMGSIISIMLGYFSLGFYLLFGPLYFYRSKLLFLSFFFNIFEKDRERVCEQREGAADSPLGRRLTWNSVPGLLGS